MFHMRLRSGSGPEPDHLDFILDFKLFLCWRHEGFNNPQMAPPAGQQTHLSSSFILMKKKHNTVNIVETVK